MSDRIGDPDRPRDPTKLGLPVRPFLYTVDQISVLLDLSEQQLNTNYLHFEGRSLGFADRDHLMARNIAPPKRPPDWRVAEQEFIRWMKRKGFKYYDRGFMGY